MRLEFVWMYLAVSVFVLLFPNLVAGDIQDTGPLRLMALAVFLLIGSVLVDSYFFDSAFFRSISRPRT